MRDTDTPMLSIGDTHISDNPADYNIQVFRAQSTTAMYICVQVPKASLPNLTRRGSRA